MKIILIPRNMYLHTTAKVYLYITYDIGILVYLRTFVYGLFFVLINPPIRSKIQLLQIDYILKVKYFVNKMYPRNVISIHKL